jgi:transcriptional regulator with XRE-family HTH domain
MDDSTLGERIRAVRESTDGKRRTQREFAELVGVEPGEISRWERGAHAPQGKNREVLEGLGVVFPEEPLPPGFARMVQDRLHELNERVRLLELASAEPGEQPAAERGDREGPDEGPGGLGAGLEVRERRRQGDPKRGRRGTGQA